MATRIEVSAPDAFRVARNFEQMGERATDLEPPFHEALTLLEEIHQKGFARLKGRYVLTGATRASLTGPGLGGIRKSSNDGLEFGSSVWYSGFLTKAPKDPELSQVRKDSSGKGRHAVLFFPTEAQTQITELLLGHIVEPFGG
jgi:hypothetical protein